MTLATPLVPSARTFSLAALWPSPVGVLENRFKIRERRKAGGPENF